MYFFLHIDNYWIFCWLFWRFKIPMEESVVKIFSISIENNVYSWWRYPFDQIHHHNIYVSFRIRIIIIVSKKHPIKNVCYLSCKTVIVGILISHCQFHSACVDKVDGGFCQTAQSFGWCTNCFVRQQCKQTCDGPNTIVS